MFSSSVGGGVFQERKKHKKKKPSAASKIFDTLHRMRRYASHSGTAEAFPMQCAGEYHRTNSILRKVSHALACAF
jgi:hypothetical protein